MPPLRAVLFLGAILWTFLVLPSLCELGEVVHARDCENAAYCTHSWEHESDPCGLSAIAPKSFAQPVADNLALPFLPTAPVHERTMAENGRRALCESTSTDDFVRLPIADSDVPLLI